MRPFGARGGRSVVVFSRAERRAAAAAAAAAERAGEGGEGEGGAGDGSAGVGGKEELFLTWSQVIYS